MAAESRVKKSLLNARVNLIFYFLTLALSFFSRKIFLDSLGTDFVGLTGTLQNLLGFLNLAELGIGTAIGYVLYKPLFDQDHSKINEIISVFGYLYSWIGKIILVAGCILACFLPFIFPNTGFELSIIYFAYFSFLASSLIGYFINYRQTLLGADQKNYVVTAYFQTMNIVKVLVQMASAYYTGSYYLWVAIELFFGIVYSFILNSKINQTYPWLKSEIRLGKQLFKKYPEVIRYTKQLFVHKLATFIQFQTTPFLIYSLISLHIVALYGNYTIITDKIIIFMDNFLGSTGASVGNLIAEGNKDKILRVFWELMAMRFLIAGVVIFAIYILLEPFVALWLGTEYLLSKSILLLVMLILFIRLIRGATDQFIYGFGLFYDTWAPISESVIFIVTAIIGGYFLGLEGVILGSIVSLIVIVGLWKPYFLFSKGFKIPVFKNYWLNFIKYLTITLISFLFCFHIVENISIVPDNWLSWIFYATISTVTFLLFDLLMLYIFTSGMKNFIGRLIKKIK